MIKCKDLFENVLFDFDSNNPITALSSLIVENETNEELYKTLVTNNNSIFLEYLVNRYDRYMSPLFLRIHEHYNGDLSETS